MAKEKTNKKIQKKAPAEARFFVDRELNAGESAVQIGKLLDDSSLKVTKYQTTRINAGKEIQINIELVLPADIVYPSKLKFGVPYVALKNVSAQDLTQKEILANFDIVNGQAAISINYLRGLGEKVQHG
jgi:hypothetical protein